MKIKRIVNDKEYTYDYSSLQLDVKTHQEIKTLAAKEMMSIKNMIKKMYKFYLENNK